MNRYEILIGKESPPPEPKPPEPKKIREILVGKRRIGKTEELLHCIRKAVEGGSHPVVVHTYKPDDLLNRLGSLRNHVYLASAERLVRECLAGTDFKELYYDDFDLVNVRKSAYEGRFGLDKFSLDRRYVEMDEMILTCDTQEMRRYCQEMQWIGVPNSVKVGFNTWEVIELPRRSKDMMYTFNQAYMGEFV